MCELCDGSGWILHTEFNMYLGYDTEAEECPNYKELLDQIEATNSPTVGIDIMAALKKSLADISNASTESSAESRKLTAPDLDDSEMWAD